MNLKACVEVCVSLTTMQDSEEILVNFPFTNLSRSGQQGTARKRNMEEIDGGSPLLLKETE